MLPLLLALNTGLSVETSTPNALCPPLGLVEAAVAERLGSIELSAPWRLHYESVHRDAGDFVRIELRDADNAVRLQREFAGYGESCATLAQVMAVVVERYFRSFQADDNLATIDEPASAPDPKKIAPSRSVQVIEAGLDVTSQAVVGPFARYVLDWPATTRPAGFFSMEFGVQPFPQGQSVLGGRAELTGVSFGLSIGVHGRLSRALTWRAGPLLVGQVEQAKTMGLAVSSRATRFLPGAGLGGALGLDLGGGFSFALGMMAWANAAFAAPEFRVDSQQIFTPAWAVVSGQAALGLSF